MYKIVKETNSDYIYNVYKKHWFFKDKCIGFFVVPYKDMNDAELIKQAMKITHPNIICYEA